MRVSVCFVRCVCAWVAWVGAVLGVVLAVDVVRLEVERCGLLALVLGRGS